MTPLPRQLGNAIRRPRKAQGYSQKSFAAHVVVHRTYMGALERGEQNVSLSILERVAKGLGLKPWELLKEADQEGGSLAIG